MSFNFDRIKDVDDYIKNIVNGCLHSSQSLFSHEQNPYYIIPELVGYLNIAYYHEPEYFAIFPEDTTVIINGNENIIAHSTASFKDISMFGNMKICFIKHRMIKIQR